MLLRTCWLILSLDVMKHPQNNCRFPSKLFSLLWENWKCFQPKPEDIPMVRENNGENVAVAMIFGVLGKYNKDFKNVREKWCEGVE